VAEWRERAEDAGVADQYVESAVALGKRAGEPVDRVEVLQIPRHQGGRTAGGANGVIEFFEPANRARDRYDMRARFRQRERGRRADAARCAGDERDAIGERLRTRQSAMPQLASASSES
jgi:hypothetical protein